MLRAQVSAAARVENACLLSIQRSGLFNIVDFAAITYRSVVAIMVIISPCEVLGLTFGDLPRPLFRGGNAGRHTPLELMRCSVMVGAEDERTDARHRDGATRKRGEVGETRWSEGVASSSLWGRATA